MNIKEIPKITLDLLKEKSSSTSFSRGKSYYQAGLVSNLTRKDDSYVASVLGNHHYEVKIMPNGPSVSFHCTCPYDWGGICKHCVAVGLYILNQGNDIVEIPKTNLKPKPEIKFDIAEIIDKATLEQKDKFLQELFSSNQDYIEKFLAFILPQNELESDIEIDSIREKIIDLLESFDLKNYDRFYDNDDYDYDYGYRQEWDVLYDGAIKELNNSLEFITKNIERNLENYNIIDASKLLLALYEGISLADCYELDDPSSIFDGELNNELIGIFRNYYKHIMPSFHATSKTPEATIRIIDIFFKRFNLFTETDFDDFFYDLARFSDFLNSLLIDEKTANYLLSYLKKLKLLDHTTHKVQLKIYITLNDSKKWLHTAEKYYSSNKEVSLELLEHYKNINLEKFIEIGKNALIIWPDDFDEYFYTNLSINDDRDFFEKVLFQYATRTQSLPLFREIKQYYDDKSIRRFIEKAKTDTLFYINLLNEQNEYETILAFVEENKDHHNFVKIIEPIINIYPKNCFEIIKNKANIYLRNNIGRKYYVEAAHWLQLLLYIEDAQIKSEVESYLKELLKKYKMRPALRDELKKVGIK